MFTLKKTAIATLAAVAIATMAFGHGGGPLKMGKTGPVGNSMSRSAGYSNKGEWNASTAYGGDYVTKQGDTVSHGTFNKKTLWWWAKFYSEGAENTPGEFAEGGGTSPWVLVNSLSASESGGTPSYEWNGWNGKIANKAAGMWAEVPTWRDGAEGAYSFTHDDIGPMPFDKSVKPGWDLAKDFPEIKQCWGVYVDKMSDADWNNAIAMVVDGHEMFNHSMDHTSAADQWQWFYPDKKIPSGDPIIPEAVRGLTVVGLWDVTPVSAKGVSQPKISWDDWIGDGASINTTATSDQGNAKNSLWLDAPGGGHPFTIIAENDLVTVEMPAYWTGFDPITGAKESDVIITPKVGVKTVRLPSGQDVYVKYTKEDLSEFPIHEGQIAATGVTWYEMETILRDYPFYYNGHYLANTWLPGDTEPTGPGGQITARDKGRPGFAATIYCVKGWNAQEMERNVVDANNVINEKLYSKVITAGEHFAKGKKSEYFGYPFDAYSEETHAYLETKGFVGARGGAKSGVPIPGDFFHPYRIDFDAFYVISSDWTTENSSNAEYLYPNNAHVLLGLNQMVDEIVAKKGYMIREFHSVADLADGAWFNDKESDLWPLNSAGLNEGGWWGGITKNQLRAHYEYVDERIEDKRLVVYTVGEATKYRMTANAVASADIVADGNMYTLTPSFVSGGTDLATKYRDEISIIVSLETACDSLAVEYPSGEGTEISPRRRPRKMDDAGRVWSVSVNPFRGAATLVPNGDWKGQGETTPIAQGGNVASQLSTVSFAGIQNGQIALNLPTGNYSAELYNLQGRMVSKVDFNAIKGVNMTGLRTSHLGKGLLILNVRQAGTAVLQQRIMLR